MERGLFITVEGGDGSGKSTQLETIRRYLEEKGIPCIFTREPGGTPIGEKIREIILDPGNAEMDDWTEALLYAASRAQHVAQKIRPALEAGTTVVCDRFVDSSIAYQGFGRGLGEGVAEVNAHAIRGLVPDITLFLDVDPQKAMERVGNRSSKDRLETEPDEFHRIVYEGYREIARRDAETGKGRFIIIDASKDIGCVTGEVREALDRAFGKDSGEGR